MSSNRGRQDARVRFPMMCITVMNSTEDLPWYKSSLVRFDVKNPAFQSLASLNTRKHDNELLNGASGEPACELPQHSCQVRLESLV